MSCGDREVLVRAAESLGWDANRLVVADGFRRRLFGLLFASPQTDVVLAFPRCKAVHTCFMCHPVDVAFLDASGNALKLYSDVKPWCFLANNGAAFVLERFCK